MSASNLAITIYLKILNINYWAFLHFFSHERLAGHYMKGYGLGSMIVPKNMFMFGKTRVYNLPTQTGVPVSLIIMLLVELTM